MKKFKLTVRNTYFLKGHLAIKNFLKFYDLRIPVIKSTTSEQDIMNSTLKIPFPSMYYIAISNGQCCIIGHKDLFLLFYKAFVVLHYTVVIFHLSLSSCLLSIALRISIILHFTANGRISYENKEINSIFSFYEIIMQIKHFIEFCSTLHVFPSILSWFCSKL